MRYMLLLLGLLFAPLAMTAGTTATVEFFPVTQYVDGAAIPASDILKYTVKWQGGSQDSAAPAVCSDKPGKLCIEVPVPCGDRLFVVTVTTKPTAKYPNSTADDSSSASYISGVACRPKAVTGVIAS